MALNQAEQTRLFAYLHRGFANTDPLVIQRALFDALFLSNVDRRNWLLGRIAVVKTRTQTMRSTVDAEATTSKATLDGELADLTTLETNL